MYRSALRSTPRALRAIRPTTLSTAGRPRFASTTSSRGTWSGRAVRWGLAIGAVYFYSTSSAFAETPAPQTVASPTVFSDADLPTVEAVVQQKRREAEERLKQQAAQAEAAEKVAAPAEDETSATTEADATPKEGMEGLEDEAGQQGAFNPETGEINWDCPCLGGMADGPCGEEFKAAFSCFVYSKEEPKGMDCIDKFQHMQDCFRLHPEVYGEELAEDDEEGPAGGAEQGGEIAAKTESSEVQEPASTPAPVAKSETVAHENGEVMRERQHDATDAKPESS